MVIKFTPKLAIISSTVGLIIISVFFIFQYFQVSRELSDLKSNPAKLTELLNSENQKILEKVSQLMELPAEKPQQIVTISDLDSIANQPLLSKAQLGDVFVLFTSAKKAILYRPSQHKIIDVIPVTASTPSPTETPIPSPRP